MPSRGGRNNTLQVCYFGTYRAEYSRNRILIEGLRLAGVQVVECHADLWTGVEDRVHAATGGWMRPRFWLRAARAYLRLLWSYRRAGDYDLMVVGYPGPVDVYLARLLTWWRRRPLVWDVLMSTYLVAKERGLDRRSPFTVGLLRRLEKGACRLPDRLLIEGPDYARWWSQTHGVDLERFRYVPLGAERPLEPSKVEVPSTGPFVALYYGTFLPSHGLMTVAKAARELREVEDIHFVLVGEGPERAKVLVYVQEAGLTKISCPGHLAADQLHARIAEADICLGVFGTTPQAMMTVQNKIFESMARGKAIISGDSAAIRLLLAAGSEIVLCARDEPKALAAAIIELKADPARRQRIGLAARRAYDERFDPAHIGQVFASHLRELLRDRASPSTPA